MCVYVCVCVCESMSMCMRVAWCFFSLRPGSCNVFGFTMTGRSVCVRAHGIP